MQYFFRDNYEADLCDRFDDLTRQYPQIRFFQPSPDKAPWHVQAIIDAADNELIELNFWPHKVKGARRPMPSVEGFPAIRELIEDAIHDAANAKTFDVIEAAE